MRRVGLIVFLLVITACSNHSEKQPIKDDFVSTGVGNKKSKRSALYSLISGSWRQINCNCNSKGRNCLPVGKDILWSFKDNDVVWGRFTHPYKISNDTIYIAGLPYQIFTQNGDTILFHTIMTNDFVQLVKVN